MWYYQWTADTYFYDGGSCETAYGYFWRTPINGSTIYSSYSNCCAYGWNDRVSSVMVPNGYVLQIYEHDFSGYVSTFYGNSGVCQYVGYNDNRMSAYALWGSHPTTTI